MQSVAEIILLLDCILKEVLYKGVAAATAGRLKNRTETGEGKKREKLRDIWTVANANQPGYYLAHCYYCINHYNNMTVIPYYKSQCHYYYNIAAVFDSTATKVIRYLRNSVRIVSKNNENAMEIVSTIISNISYTKTIMF